MVNLNRWLTEFRDDGTSPSVQCATYVLLHLFLRHGDQWLSSPRHQAHLSKGDSAGALGEILKMLGATLRPRQLSRLRSLNSIGELYRHFYFRGVVLDAHEGLVAWLENRYPLVLRLDIPTPTEMLEIQCRGQRYVTLLLDPAAQFQAHGRHRDACDFLLHDFEHAHKFFADPTLHRGQVQFFRLLHATGPALDPWMQDSLFLKDLNYLKSDMNSHPVHLAKYLKAIVLAAEVRRRADRHPPLEKIWLDIFGGWDLPSATQASLFKLNHPELETVQDQERVRDFFIGSTAEVKNSCGTGALNAK